MLLLLLLLMVMETVVRADKAPIDIYWNSSNPIFKTSHVIEVNYKMNILYGIVNIRASAMHKQMLDQSLFNL